MYELHIHAPKVCSKGVAFYLLLRESTDKELRERCFQRVRMLYGDVLPDEIKDRVEKELNCLSATNSDTLFLALSNVFRNTGWNDAEIYAEGCLGNSFLAYLLGINGGVNPLRPHYRCQCGKFADFKIQKEVRLWCDLPDRRCPICGSRLIRDGYGLDDRFFYGARGDKEPYISYGIARQRLDGIRSAFGMEDRIRNFEECGLEEIYGVWDNGNFLMSSILGEGQSPLRKITCDFIISRERLTKIEIPFEHIAELLAESWKRTGVCPHEIPLDDPQTEHAIQNGEGLDILRKISPEQVYPESFKIHHFYDLVRFIALCRGANIWTGEIEELIKNGIITQSDVPCSRDELLERLLRAGVDDRRAFQCAERVRKGTGLLAEQEEELRLCGVPEWFIRLCMNVEYLAPLADSISYAGMIWRLQYYTIHYPG